MPRKQEGAAVSQQFVTGKLTNRQTIPWNSLAVPVPLPPQCDVWMGLGMSCSHGAHGDRYEPISGSCSAGNQQLLVSVGC